MSPDAFCRIAAGGNRSRHGGLHCQLRRFDDRTTADAGASAGGPAEWRLGHRRRHGDRDSVAQPARSGGGGAPADQEARGGSRGSPGGAAGTGLPRRRTTHLDPGRHPRRLCRRPRVLAHARALAHRGTCARPVARDCLRTAAWRFGGPGAVGNRGSDQSPAACRQEGCQPGTEELESPGAGRARQRARRIQRPTGGAHHAGAQELAPGTGRIHGRAAGSYQPRVQRFGQSDHGRPRWTAAAEESAEHSP